MPSRGEGSRDQSHTQVTCTGNCHLSFRSSLKPQPQVAKEREGHLFTVTPDTHHRVTCCAPGSGRHEPWHRKYCVWWAPRPGGWRGDLGQRGFPAWEPFPTDKEVPPASRGTGVHHEPPRAIQHRLLGEAWGRGAGSAGGSASGAGALTRSREGGACLQCQRLPCSSPPVRQEDGL